MHRPGNLVLLRWQPELFAPLLLRLRHTNRPETKNINAMKKVSLMTTISPAAAQRWLSTTGTPRHASNPPTNRSAGAGANGR